jgi:hypothetical protein
MKKTVCDYCGKEFSTRDEYVGASITLKYTYYAGDDGSEDINQHNDMCERCLEKQIEAIGTLKKR